MTQNVSIRLANFEDNKDLFDWRNEEQSLKMSINTKKKLHGMSILNGLQSR